MWTSLFSLFFALIGLGFLIFIHELGHYWMARRVGMRVEAFGIGFGRAIMSFERKGVKWNIGWIPFGGYVKIAGMEQEKKKDSSKKEIELHEVEDGFFGRSPWDRIKVSFAGPAVNILFAFLVFCGLWWAGGREKNFSDATKKIGWLDPSSELYKLGLRPGDEIEFFDTQSVKSFKDHMQAAMTKGPEVLVKGRHYNPVNQAFEPFSYEIRAYQHPYLESGLMTFGALAPASLLVYPDGSDPLLLKNSPLEASGIHPGDRIVSLDTERVYSFQQLSHLLNDGRILVTVRRGNELLQRRIPVLHIEELKLDSAVREELSDWQWETPFKAEKLQKLFFIPYNLNSEGVVEGRIALGDTDAEAALFPTKPDSEKETTLQKGDVIVAVNGKSVHTIAELFAALQTKKVTLVVQRNWQPARLISAENADSFYDTLTQEKDLSAIENAIGSEQPITESGKFVQLTPVAPVTRRELQMSLQKKSAASAVDEEKKLIQAIDNPEKRTLALKQLEARENQLILGLPATDMHVSYNPNPVAQFGEITDEMMNTLGAIAGGYLNPKWLSGPVGIVQVFQSQWTVGFKEAMFWLAIISLNLGLLNLLPLPVLDGGYIALSFFEIVTGVRIKAKTLEKIIVPFAILLIGFFIFITFNDVSRLITNLWPLR